MRAIKRILGGLLLAAIVIGLSGCGASRQVENQAYILVMGLDLSEDGELVITALSPKISGGGGDEGGSSGSGSESGDYLHLSVRGESYERALERLNWAVPRTLNLSQLKLIVFSQELVEQVDCGDLFREIAKTELLFTAAHVVVSAGKAQEFIENLQPTVGTRLSTDIEASIEHYVNYGITPDSRLATLYYQTESVYSDPLAIYAMLSDAESSGSDSENGAQPASALSGPAEQVSQKLDSDIRTRYLGAAVFCDGEYCGLLDGGETVLANLLTDSLNLFWYTLEDECIKLNTVGKPKIKVDTSADPVKIEISIRLSVSNQDHRIPEEKLRGSLKSDIEALIEHAQRMGAEPFGFAEVAARNFLTLDQWQDFDWREKFRRADVEIKLRFEQLNT